MKNNDYPFNLIRTIYEDDRDDTTHTETTYIKGFYEQLKTLSKIEQSLLSMRFKDGYTLNQCGEGVDLSTSRVRQIISQALRKMRNRSRTRYYEAVPKIELKRMSDRYERISYKNMQLKETIDILEQDDIDPYSIILLAKFIEPKRMQDPISVLNLTTRTYNGLSRAEIHTIEDVIATPDERWDRIRNIGEKSLQDLKNKIKAYLLLPDSYQNEQEDLI